MSMPPTHMHTVNSCQLSLNRKAVWYFWHHGVHHVPVRTQANHT